MRLQDTHPGAIATLGPHPYDAPLFEGADGPRPDGIKRPMLSSFRNSMTKGPAKIITSGTRRHQPFQPFRVKVLGGRYTTASYRQAIARGCKKADIPGWRPHQIRHNAATWLRREFGLDAARVILGHTSPAVTEVYAEVDRDKAVGIMGRVG